MSMSTTWEIARYKDAGSRKILVMSLRDDGSEMK